MDKVLDELQKINGRLDSMEAKFEARFEKVEACMDSMQQESNERFERLESGMNDMRSDFNERLDDVETNIKHMQLGIDTRLEVLAAGQASIRAEIKGLRHDLFIEEGSRAHADDTLFGEQHEDYKKLEQRVRMLEAKFPDLTQQAA